MPLKKLFEVLWVRLRNALPEEVLRLMPNTPPSIRVALNVKRASVGFWLKIREKTEDDDSEDNFCPLCGRRLKPKQPERTRRLTHMNHNIEKHDTDKVG
jgi:hypothetical protein